MLLLNHLSARGVTGCSWSGFRTLLLLHCLKLKDNMCFKVFSFYNIVIHFELFLSKGTKTSFLNVKVETSCGNYCVFVWLKDCSIYKMLFGRVVKTRFPGVCLISTEIFKSKTQDVCLLITAALTTGSILFAPSRQVEQAFDSMVLIVLNTSVVGRGRVSTGSRVSLRCFTVYVTFLLGQLTVGQVNQDVWKRKQISR